MRWMPLLGRKIVHQPYYIMKQVLLLALLMTALSCTSQNPKPKVALEGRAFKIENYTGGKLDGTETMAFKNGMVENDECVKWGFAPGAYTSDDDGNFKFTLLSEQEGKMEWEGQVTGTAVSGKMVWTKAGQDDIHYTFKGEEIKN